MTSSKVNKTLALYQKLSRWPLGNKLFSLAICRMAPYFGSVSPLITQLSPNHCECLLKKRRRLENHIGTLHVIAICNGLELAMGAMAEASIPRHLRWIPKGMNLDYTAKAGSDIRCVAELPGGSWQPGDLMVKVTAYDSNDIVVVSGQIRLWISAKS
ncbi:hotdog fold domain-containing protein [Shewanella sp. NFH-SH190041]|uniref:hotdog fold domain-containing protein n=1 Tax=Shewanella sp. NFH-SH190041 TaxID=2950245 RepID=UPI0021C4B723|nr:hotdog fold domain-containing protein [Shewanella sp. NFH-SH190041]